MSASTSRTSSANSTESRCSSATRSRYVETHRKNCFLESLTKLPRPQATIEDGQFLCYYSLEAQKLTLSDVLNCCNLSYCNELLEEFPFASANVNFSSKETAVTTLPKIHLNLKLLSAKQQQITSLIQLYENQIQWLSCSSRLWFGQLKGRSASVLIDYSDAACFSHFFTQYLTALKLLVTEQFSSIDEVQVSAIGTDIANTDPPLLKLQNNPHSLDYIKEWLVSLKSQGSCNLLSGLKQSLLESSSNVDTVAIILCSKPNQNLDIIRDYLSQILVGWRRVPYLHLVSIDTSDDIQIFLKSLSEEMGGNFHHVSFKENKLILMEDTFINEINNEIDKAKEIIADIENIKRGIYDTKLLDCLRQLSIISELPNDDSFTPPTSPSQNPPYTLSLSSSQWLQKFGIDALGLNLYTVLAPNAYNQVSEYVSLIDKSAISTVYDVVMPKFTWSDGTCKYLHIDINCLNKYINDLKIYIELIKKRISWLLSNSRVPFGNISEKRVILLLDTSIVTGLYLTQLQQHLKTLLNEQFRHLEGFNLMSYGDYFCEWSNNIVSSTKESLAEAWKWILNINPEGTSNLLGALCHILESPSYKDESIGLYVVVSSMPNQNEIVLSSYLEQKLSGSRNINLHLIYYQPTSLDLLSEVTLRKGKGCHGDSKSIMKCIKHIAEQLGTYHQYTSEEFVKSDDLLILNSELVRANSYLSTAQQLLDDYREYCKRNIPTQSTEECDIVIRPKTAPPTYPRQTLSSLARLNCTSNKLKETRTKIEIFSRKVKQEDKYLMCHCYYIGTGLKKGVYHELMESELCTKCKKSLIPSREEIMSSSKWLSKYSLNQLQLYYTGMFCSCKNGFKHITTDGRVVELSMSHQQLVKILKLLKTVRLRYIDRLQWILSDNRKVFGCITESKVTILIDASSSMKQHSLILKDQLATLVKNQLSQKPINMFNIIAFATQVLPWQPHLVSNTSENRCSAEKWIQSLKFEGSSSLYDALKYSLSLQAQSIYLITDGDTDHTRQFIVTHLQQLQELHSKLPWKLHAVAYEAMQKESRELLRMLTRLTNGRYNYYSSRCQYTFTNVMSNSSALEQDIKLGDDVKLLKDEILLADYAIKQTLHHLGR